PCSLTLMTGEIGYQQQTSRHQDPSGLAYDCQRVSRMMKHHVCDHALHRSVRKGQMGHLPETKVHTADSAPQDSAACLLQHRRRVIHSDDIPPAAGKVHKKCPRAHPDFEEFYFSRNCCKQPVTIVWNRKEVAGEFIPLAGMEIEELLTLSSALFQHGSDSGKVGAALRQLRQFTFYCLTDC